MERLVGLTALFQLLLMLVTSSLWTGVSDFPAVPLFAVPIPGFVLPVSSALLVLGCVLILPSLLGRSFPAGELKKRLLAGIVLLIGLIPGVINIHCFQAWHCFFLMVMLIRAVEPTHRQRASLMMVLGGLYLCSGLSRISPQIDSGISALVMQQLIPRQISPQLSAWLTRLALAGEILLGLCCLGAVKRSWLRLPILGSAVLMHISLLFALGPLRLNHHAGVLLWNLFFVLLIPLLLRPGINSGSSARGGIIAVALLFFSGSGLCGLADNWAGWQLYSDRPERWELWIHDWSRSRLPDAYQRWLSTRSVGGWRILQLDRMCLAQTGSPMYPEDRFHLGVVERILSQSDPDLRFRILIDEPDGLIWWRRRQREIRSVAGLVDERSQFLLNATAAVR